MNIISVDLPWKEEIKGRRALAIADLDGNVKMAPASNDDELLQLVLGAAEPESIILLDIPIDGCENLGGKHFRPVDKALARQGITILPTSKAKDRGKVLKGCIQRVTRGKRITVQEIYPYAIYKFLSYLKDKNLLQSLRVNKLDLLLDNKFRAYPPPKYKRERERVQRLKNVRYLYSILTDSSIGLNFSPPLHYPNVSYTLSGLNELCDEYDAFLGAIVGICFANNNCYACIAGDSDSGSILLLADRWLSAQLGKETKITKPKGD